MPSKQPSPKTPTPAVSERATVTAGATCGVKTYRVYMPLPNESVFAVHGSRTGRASLTTTSPQAVESEPSPQEPRSTASASGSMKSIKERQLEGLRRLPPDDWVPRDNLIRRFGLLRPENDDWIRRLGKLYGELINR